MVVVIVLCDGFGDQTFITRTGVDCCRAIMVVRMCGCCRHSSSDDRHYINKWSCMKYDEV